MVIQLGTDGDDSLHGTEGADQLSGGLGNDTLHGGHWNDILDGGSGDDVLNGDGANDSLTGGPGNDTLNGGEGQDALDGGEGDDVLSGDGANDSLTGGPGNDTLDGGQWHDTLDGGPGDDVLSGGEWNDTLIVGAGNDTLDGGGHTDTLVFPFASTEVVPGALEVTGTSEFRISGELLGPDVLQVQNVELYQFQDGVTWTLAQLRATLTPDDFPADQTTTGQLAVGGQATGRIETPSDVDWFAIELQAGQDYRLETETDRIPNVNPSGIRHVGLYDASGSLIPGTNSFITTYGTDVLTLQDFSPTATGTYYLAAGSENGRPAAYTVRARQLVDDYGADMATAGQITVGGPEVRGGIQKLDDQDWFAVDLVAGQSYRVVMTSEFNWDKRDLLLDPQILGLRAPDGQMLPESGGSSLSWRQPVTAEFTAAQSGTHHIMLASISGTASGAYTLEVVQLVTLTGTSGNDWLSLPASGPVDLFAVRGGNGIDMMSFAGLDAGIHVNTHSDRVVSSLTDTPFDLVMESIENVTGTGHADVFVGSDRAETFRGLGGADLFIGSDGGRDIYLGGGGRDLLSYAFSSEGVSVSLLRGAGFSGDARRDVIRDIENLAGSAHDDLIWGDHGANRLQGRAGDDTLMGNGGDDYILGGFGTDVALYAGNRSDYEVRQDGSATWVTDLTGGTGTDLLGQIEILRFADGDLLL